MVILLQKPATADQIKQAATDLDGYIKFVVDVEREVMTIGGLRHFEGEQLLLSSGSNQQNLWGGGWDQQSQEMDFDSVINIRPPANPSREILDQKLRQQAADLVKKFIRP